MRYIRTIETDYGCIIDTQKYKNETGEDCYIPENEIVKSADTIEELCDEFVAIGYGISKKPMVVNYNKFELVKSMSKECEIYGSIWIGADLKSVAKIKGILPNSEIDWELL